MTRKTVVLLLSIGGLLTLGLITGCTATSGWGVMGQNMQGMMGGGMGWGGSASSGTPITMDQAITLAQQYIGHFNNPDLKLAEVMQFDNHFYAEAMEASTGMHAFEMLIDRYSGRVYPEPGPNMMWNMKYGQQMSYGMMGFAMHGGRGSGGPMTVSAQQAKQDAQQYLNKAMPGTTVSDDADAFYGYYTMHVLRNGQIMGMLSINGYTGQVWYHSWHGQFMDMRSFDKQGS